MAEQGSFIPDIWAHQLDAVLGRSTFLDLFDRRTPEEKAAERERALVRAEQLRADHAAALASAASPLASAMLALHAPVFGYPGDTSPDCHGCDYSGSEPEPPSFPCRTYKLALIDYAL